MIVFRESGEKCTDNLWVVNKWSLRSRNCLSSSSDMRSIGWVCPIRWTAFGTKGDFVFEALSALAALLIEAKFGGGKRDGPAVLSDSTSTSTSLAESSRRGQVGESEPRPEGAGKYRPECILLICNESERSPEAASDPL